MFVTLRMTYHTWRQALLLLKATPELAITATAVRRELPGEIEYLIASVALERPLFMERAAPAPHVRITRLREPAAFDALVKKRRGEILLDPAANRVEVDLALSPSQGFRGVYWVEDEPRVIERLEIPGRGMVRLHHGQGPLEAPPEPRARSPLRRRFSREIGAFGGPRNFNRFRDSTFCVIGAGRTGSLVAHGLARLEPGRIVLVDPDRLEDHNIPSMDVSADARPGRAKVKAVQAFLRSVHARCEVEAHAAPVIAPGVFEAVSGAEILISAVDHSRARLEASLMATLFLRPHLDIGTGILNFPGRRRAGWDVRLIVPGDGCLLCVGGLPGVDRPRPRDFRQERAGSSRFLNMEAVGHGLRLLSRLYQGSIGRSLWHRLDEEPGGEDELTVMDRRLEEQCAMCRFRGLGDRAAGRAAEVIRGRAPRRELSDRQAARLMRLETFLDL